MKDIKVELINKSKSYDRHAQMRPRATIFRDKSKWYRPSEKEYIHQELEGTDWEQLMYDEEVL